MMDIYENNADFILKLTLLINCIQIDLFINNFIDMIPGENLMKRLDIGLMIRF